MLAFRIVIASTGLLAFAFAAEPWKGGKPTVDDLWAEYQNIFPSNNRNAASHRWASFILNRTKDLDVEVIKQLFRGFCAVSGSPVRPVSHKRHKYTLPMVAGGNATGFLYHCCSPCVCDTQEFIKLDTKTIETKSGMQQFKFQVIGNPCSSPSFASIYNKLWNDPFAPGKQSSLAQDAPDVKCNGEQLEAAVLSDNGNIIVGMMLDEADAHERMTFRDVASDEALRGFCQQRKKAGYNSGMGVIFAKVANITRPQAKAGSTHAQAEGSNLRAAGSAANAASKASSGTVAPLSPQAHASVTPASVDASILTTSLVVLSLTLF